MRVPGWRSLLSLAAGVALSRLPFLGGGYGSDMDAWSLASAARWIAEHGRYGASRFPGHPVQELTCALLWRGGPWALNGATALMSVAAAVAFARLLGTLGARNAWLGGLALAFTPVVFIHSTDAMDFVWSLPFLIAGLEAALRGRAALAGMLVGIATGCRITSAAMLPAVALLLAGRAGSPRGALRPLAALLLSFGVAGGLVLAPLIARFGASFLAIYESHVAAEALDVAKNGTIEVWGLVGSLTLLGLAAALAFPRLRSAAIPRVELGAWMVAIAIYVAGFLRLPFDAGYLLPAVPVVIALAARVLARPAFALLCLGLIASPLTLEVAEVGKPDSPSPSRLAMTLRIRGRPVVIDPLQGPLAWDQARRRAQLRHRDRIRAAADAAAAGGEVVVITDGWTAYLTVDHRAASADPRFVHALDGPRAAALRARGVRLFYLPEAQWNYRAAHGIGLESIGATPLTGIATVEPGGR
ncbi:MAG: hypothetical protein ACRENJ_00575 [Candidatus Eiseniibacteriota bacterium]